jgi:hypothetical protein
MEKKITVEVNGRTIRIMPHMLNDALKFGANKIKKVIKNAPKELLTIPKTEVLPEMVITESIVQPDVAQTEPVKGEGTVNVPEPEKKIRKKPVRSKTK